MAPLDTLSSRTPFAWLRERDIDLLLCAEIHAGEAATRMLARIAGAEAAGFLGHIVMILGLTPAELATGMVLEVRAALDLTLGVRFGLNGRAAA